MTKAISHVQIHSLLKNPENPNPTSTSKYRKKAEPS